MGGGAAPPPVSASAATEFHEPDGGAQPPGADGRATGGRGTQFGRYTLLDRLGEGGMAEVYTAATFGAEGFRRTFVVKRLRAELAREPAVVAQFIDEANLASNLVHSNIIPVFDFGKVGDEYFMAQEYILGRDLGRLTLRSVDRRQRALAPLVVFYAAAETLKALEYAHAKLGDNGRPLGIVHRDVSPSNILLSARGEVKLFDFGIVKAEGRVTKTQHGVVKGNVSFMSPEQARGTDIDARADLFSLGLVMYYCLTGDVLYRGNTTYELLVKAATGPTAEELQRIAGLPSPAAEIVRRALEVDPGKRFQNAADFAAALAPHVAGAPAEATRLMKDLFTDDFQQEEARFAAAIPTTDRNAAGAAGPGGTREFGARRP
jgi:serine/threonine protein kinase